MAKAIAYVNRDGGVIDKSKWEALQKDPSITTVRNYDNGVVQVVLKWVGRVDDPQNTFRDYWKVFMLVIKNYRDGRLVMDPESDQWFADEKAAIAAYDAFLLRWTESKADAEGNLVEEGNTLELPESPDPNKPVSVSEELSGDVW